ncbi:MAG: hypothetical protein LBC92_05740 [Rickettsiales bacterium]|jgi:hypothetical protein|nr:hypothetical protein [Rickettsiales bacterium]
MNENNVVFRYFNGKPIRENSKNILDQYYTKQETAKKLFNKAQEIINKYEIIRMILLG